LYWMPELMKAFKMRRFLLSKMALSQKKCYTRTDLKDFSQQYDVVICGSDQVWFKDGLFRSFDPSFFLDFVCNKTTRRMSYAATFGSTNYFGEKEKLVNQLINQFDAIAVRDSHSLDIIHQKFNRPAIRVLDPTFLIGYSEIMSVPKFSKEYLLIYNIEQLTPQEENFATLIAEIKNLAIISVGKHNKIAQRNLIGISPEEWIGHFSKASYIITNSYHGAIFSITFKKPFTVFNPKNKPKITDLLKYLDLESRILSNPMEFSSIREELLKIDYDLVHKKLEKEVSRSKAYLFEAIGGKQVNQGAELCI
ncbi:MAG: polysaccharide pyruvyl transferase family protein, partial [Coleofasciculus sp. S288]|nr:polysaccharide pyruvyl transferase family protein [Coleofasciculus sp. S288]